MRFLIYILIVAAAAGFFIYHQETSEPIPPLDSLPVFSFEPVTTTDSTTTPSIIPPPKPVPARLIQPKPAVDQNTLSQIQAKLSETTQTVKDLEKPLAPAEPKVRLPETELYNKAIARVVNFFCQQGGQVRVASGVIISPQGHILTNAHVAEGYDKDFECAIRQGSPARNLGYAKIIMMPQAYTHATTRQAQADNDVSIWKFSRPAGETPLPETFPYYEIDTKKYPEVNQILSTFSYPSELLGYETLLKNLNLFVAETIIMDYDRDIILSSTGLSSQVGSSGGILIDIYTNQFAGLIFGVSKDEQINKRKLFSLTPSSLERVIQAETGLSLDNFLK